MKKKHYIIPVVELVSLRTDRLMEIEGVSYKPSAPGSPAPARRPELGGNAPVF